MGADGHIEIYHLSPVYEKYGEEKSKKFLNLVSDSMTYVHTFICPKGAEYEVLTKYWGDNLYDLDSFIDRVFHTVQKDNYGKRLGRYDYEYIEENELTYDEVVEMCQFLNKQRMDSWEVWT